MGTGIWEYCGMFRFSKRMAILINILKVGKRKGKPWFSTVLDNFAIHVTLPLLFYSIGSIEFLR